MSIGVSSRQPPWPAMTSGTSGSPGSQDKENVAGYCAYEGATVLAGIHGWPFSGIRGPQEFGQPRSDFIIWIIIWLYDCYYIPMGCVNYYCIITVYDLSRSMAWQLSSKPHPVEPVNDRNLWTLLDGREAVTLPWNGVVTERHMHGVCARYSMIADGITGTEFIVICG